MKERDFQSLFSKNYKDIISKLEQGRETDESYAFELKIAKDKSISFDRLDPHQILALENVHSGVGVYHKISDHAMGRGTQSPFDCMFIRGWSYVVICWYKPRELKEMHFINIRDFTNEKQVSKRKSLTYEKSKEVSTLIYDLKCAS